MGSATMTEPAVADVTVIQPAVAEITTAEITVMKSLVAEFPAVRDPFVMIVKCSTAVPVVPPVTPAPAKSAKETDTKSNTKGKADAAPKNARFRIPSRVGYDGYAVH